MKDIAYKILMIAPMMATCSVAFAQLNPGGPPATPIDGGLGILLAAGGAYGLKKLRDKRRKDIF